MTGWRLDPAGIRAVLASVDAEAQGLSEALVGTPEAPVDRGETVLNGLTWGTDGMSWAAQGGEKVGLTTPVFNAVCAALAAQTESVTSIMNRINAGMLGVANATLAYAQGNEDMAAEFQTQAALAADRGDFAWFEANGVR